LSADRNSESQTSAEYSPRGLEVFHGPAGEIVEGGVAQLGVFLVCGEVARVSIQQTDWHGQCEEYLLQVINRKSMDHL
jgi:hypothetical protein